MRSKLKNQHSTSMASQAPPRARACSSSSAGSSDSESSYFVDVVDDDVLSEEASDSDASGGAGADSDEGEDPMTAQDLVTAAYAVHAPPSSTHLYAVRVFVRLIACLIASQQTLGQLRLQQYTNHASLFCVCTAYGKAASLGYSSRPPVYQRSNFYLNVLLVGSCRAVANVLEKGSL